MKVNIARIDKGKNSDVNAEVSKPMSKTLSRKNKNSEFVPTCHHCHIVGPIRPNCPKLRSLSTSKVIPPSRKHSSSKITHVCHHCGVSSHIRPNCFKLFPHKRVSNRSHPLSKGSVPILGELLKALSFLTQFQLNSNSSMSFSSHARTRAFSSSRPKTRTLTLLLDFLFFWESCFHAYASSFMLYFGQHVFVYLFLVLLYFVLHKLKNQKNIKTVCVLCTLVLVYL